jgi:hypothetical protein
MLVTHPQKSISGEFDTGEIRLLHFNNFRKGKPPVIHVNNRRVIMLPDIITEIVC